MTDTPDFGLNSVREAVRFTVERGRFIVRLLEQRRDVLSAILRLGGIAAPESFEAVKAKEQELRAIDEALGILRYGA